jgi:two-component system sensor histidine kinase KdpD
VRVEPKLPRWSGYAAGGGIVAATTVASWTILGREERADIVMLYLLGVVIVSMRYGYGPSLLAAVLSVLAFDFFFIPPLFNLRVADLRHVTTFGVMFFVAVVISRLTRRVREQAEEAHRARLQIETEQLKNSVLSSVSHDLRTPLAVITGTAGTLLDARIDDSTRRELTDTILQESERLNRLVQNLLDMSRVESGALFVKKQWQPLEEVVGTALNRMEKTLGDRTVDIELPADLALVPLDSVLIEQVLVNLLENAAKYTPPGAPVGIHAAQVGGAVEVTIADRGPGIEAGQEDRVFEKFFRARPDRGGAGLGLTICKGIVLAHGGRIWAERREGGGALFRFTLPIDGEPPMLEPAAVMNTAAPNPHEVRS